MHQCLRHPLKLVKYNIFHCFRRSIGVLLLLLNGSNERTNFPSFNLISVLAKRKPDKFRLAQNWNNDPGIIGAVLKELSRRAIKLGAGCCDSGFIIFLQCKLSYDNHGNAEYHFAVIES